VGSHGVAQATSWLDHLGRDRELQLNKVRLKIGQPGFGSVQQSRCWALTGLTCLSDKVVPTERATCRVPPSLIQRPLHKGQAELNNPTQILLPAYWLISDERVAVVSKA
jgi:hypothetical protein